MNVLLTTLNAKYIHKNLALRYLYVTKPEGFHCEIKEYTIKDNIDRIVNEILERNDAVIGFSTYIWNIEQTCEIVRKLKKCKPELVIVLGGPEVSFDGPHFLHYLGVDAVVCGEGEFVFWEYLSKLKNKTASHEAIDGVFTQVSTPVIPYAITDLKKLETYPNPYFLPFDEEQMANRYFYIETSRGCPYRCKYCLSSVQGNVRMFSQNYVLDVLKKVFAQPVRQVKFLDRTFNVDKNRALFFASHIQENARNDQIFQFEIMAEYVSDELIAYLKQKPKLPQFRFEVGIQSTNQRALTEIDRIQNFGRLTKVVNELQSTKCHELHVDLIAGLPFENLLSFKKSFNDVFSLHASELQLGFLKLLRGTSLREMADEYGMSYDQKAPYQVSQTKWMSRKDIAEVHEVAYAVDVLYNTQRLRNTIDTILKSTNLSPYELFLCLGKELMHSKYRQLDELFTQIYQILGRFMEPKLALSLLSNDYYALFKQRPKRFHNHLIDEQIKEKIYRLLIDKHSINEMMHYGLFDYGYYEENGIGKVGYQFVLYNKLQTYPLRYLINDTCSHTDVINVGRKGI